MKRFYTFALFTLLISCIVPGVSYSYDIPSEFNMVRVDGTISVVYTSSARPDWAALLVVLPESVTVRLNCGDLAEDRGCFELEEEDRVLIYGHLKPSIECAYDPPCTEVQVDSVRRYDPETDVWSLWVGDSWYPGI